MTSGEKWQIIGSKITLSQSYLSKEGDKNVYDLLTNDRGAFNLMDEIGTCPNIEVNLKIIGKFLFFYKIFSFQRGKQTNDR